MSDTARRSTRVHSFQFNQIRFWKNRTTRMSTQSPTHPNRSKFLNQILITTVKEREKVKERMKITDSSETDGQRKYQ